MADTQPTTVRKIGTAVTAVLLGGTVVAGALVGQNTNANSLEPTAVKALQSAGITGVDVSFKGREAYLTGQGATDAQLQQAKQVVEGIYGVRWATVTGGPYPATPLETAPTQPPATPEETPTPATTPTPTPTPTPTSTATPKPSTPPTTPSTPAPSESPAPSATPSQPTSGLTADQVSQINNTVITFANGSYSLNAAAKKNLDAVIPLIAQSSVNITIDGYVSLPHPAGREVIDSKRRAQAVANYLIANGIDANRLNVVGDGPTNPVASNDTLQGQAANRRATLTVS